MDAVLARQTTQRVLTNLNDDFFFFSLFIFLGRLQTPLFATTCCLELSIADRLSGALIVARRGSASQSL